MIILIQSKLEKYMVELSLKEHDKQNNLSDTKYFTSDIKSFWKFNNKLGLLNLFYGIDYQRCLEYPAAFNQLAINSEVETVLDIGTGKHSIFPLYIASVSPNTTVRITDLGNYVFKQLDRINHLKILKNQLLHSKIIIEKQDATNLTYEDNSFDRISAISAIEHIVNNGDSLSIKEMIRVLKPKGRLVVTVPYKYDGYAASYRQRTTYTNKYKDEPVFFSHYYDDNAIQERLTSVSDASLESILYLGETDFAYFDFWCKKVPLRNFIKYFVGWINPIMALKYYRILSSNDKCRAHVAVITLIKR